MPTFCLCRGRQACGSKGEEALQAGKKAGEIKGEEAGRQANGQLPRAVPPEHHQPPEPEFFLFLQRDIVPECLETEV